MKLFKQISILALLACFVVPAFAEVAVIVNPANSNALTDKQVRKIFLGKSKSYPDGSEIVSFELDSGDAARDAFLKKVVKKDEATYSSHWARMLFSSKAQPPTKVSAGEIVSKVASTPGGIGYVDASKVNSSVKVLMTIN